MKKRILTLGVVLALVAVLAVPGAVLATTEVTGNVTEGYTFAAPSPIDLGNMTPGTTATGSSIDEDAGSLEGNNPTGYTVKAKDDKTPDTGYMVSGGNVLATEFQMQDKDSVWCNASAVGTTFLDVGAAGSYSFPFNVRQYVTYGDTVATGYTITITFTVTPKT